jgi:hypothetical protein
MTDIIARCPGCKAKFKIRGAERLGGKKIVCRKCETPFRIRLPKAAAKRGGDDEVIEIGDEAVVSDDELVVADEFGGDLEFEDAQSEPAAAGDDDDYGRPARLPTPGRLAPRKKKDKSPAEAEKPGKPDAKARPAAKKSKTLLIVAASFGGLVALAAIGSGIYLVQRGLAAPKFEPPQKYVDFKPDAFTLAASIPEGWERDYGGGRGGQPSWARFGDGKLRVEIRESISGGAMAQAAIAAAQKAGADGGDPDARDPVLKIHLMQKDAFAENFHEYSEAPADRIKTGFGDSRVADFSGTEGMFRTKVKGCRATVMNSLRQFTISCKCPPSIFDQARPVFHKIVASVGSGSMP